MNREVSLTELLERRLRQARLRRLNRKLYDRDLYSYWDKTKLKAGCLPKHVRVEALRLYSAWKRRVEGRTLLSALEVASLLKASRAYGYPLYLGRALEMFPPGRHRLTEALSILGVEPARPETFIPLIVSRMPVETGHEVLVKSLRKARGISLQGRKPQVVAAAIVYQSCRSLSLRVTLRRVARAAGVSESSVRGALRALARFKSAADRDAGKRGGGPDGEGGLRGDTDAGGKRGGGEEPQAGG